MLNSRAIESIYGMLGVRPVINAAGIYTDLGGSVLSPTVRDAVHEVNGTFASMTELSTGAASGSQTCSASRLRASCRARRRASPSPSARA